MQWARLVAFTFESMKFPFKSCFESQKQQQKRVETPRRGVAATQKKLDGTQESPRLIGRATLIIPLIRSDGLSSEGGMRAISSKQLRLHFAYYRPPPSWDRIEQSENSNSEWVGENSGRFEF